MWQAESRKGVLLLKGFPWESLVIQKTDQIWFYLLFNKKNEADKLEKLFNMSF